MMRKVLLFPSSAYLATHWWHRLAIVVFWGWFVFVLACSWVLMIGGPFSTCIETRIHYEIALEKPSGLDCGDNAAEYLWLNLKTSSGMEIAGGFSLVVAALYVVLIAPGLLYRLVLYIAKGASWEDAKAV